MFQHPNSKNGIVNAARRVKDILTGAHEIHPTFTKIRDWVEGVGSAYTKMPRRMGAMERNIRNFRTLVSRHTAGVSAVFQHHAKNAFQRVSSLSTHIRRFNSGHQVRAGLLTAAALGAAAYGIHHLTKGKPHAR